MPEVYTLLVAVALGALIGLERKLNDHTTGIHTHALVSLGAALFILLGVQLAAPTETARVASQVVMGMGFLCGAVIMRDGLQVRGVNTAVTIWCSSAIGAIAGTGNYKLATMGTVIIVLANFLLHLVEHHTNWFGNPPEYPSSKNDTQPK